MPACIIGCGPKIGGLRCYRGPHALSAVGAWRRNTILPPGLATVLVVSREKQKEPSYLLVVSFSARISLLASYDALPTQAYGSSAFKYPMYTPKRPVIVRERRMGVCSVVISESSLPHKSPLLEAVKELDGARSLPIGERASHGSFPGGGGPSASSSLGSRSRYGSAHRTHGLANSGCRRALQ